MHLRRKNGQGMVEVSLVIALVAIAAILALTLLGNTAYQVYSNVVCDVQGADPSVFPTSPCAHFTGASPSPTVSQDPGGYPKVIKADAPSAYWRLDETGVINGSTAKDEIPTDGSAGPNGSDPGTYNTNSGTIVSGISPSAIVVGSSGLIKGTSVSFTGGANMSAGTLTALHGDNVRSVEVWFKSTDNVQAQNIFETGSAGAGNAMMITLNPVVIQEGTDINYNAYNSAALEVSFQAAGEANFRNGASGYQVVFPKMNLADGNWHYLAVTLSGTTLNVYVDDVQPMGSIQGDGTNGGTGISQLQPMVLAFTPNTATAGLDWGGNTLAGHTWDGQLDEAAVYNFALSAAQVANHYAYGVGAPVAQQATSYSTATLAGDNQNGCPTAQLLANTCAPQAYWRLGDAGAVAYDATGNDPGNYNGSIAQTSPSLPVGQYAQSVSTGTGTNAVSTAFDVGSSATVAGYGGQQNAVGSGVRANTVPAMQGNNSRSIKVWFQTSSTAPVQALVDELSQFGRTFANQFDITLLSPIGAGPNGAFAGVGGTPNASQGGIEVNYTGSQVYVPATANLADGNWHYLVVEVALSGAYSIATQVYIDNIQMSGYACCPGNAWSSLQTGGSITPGGDSNFPNSINSGTADITLGYDIPPGGSLGDWFKGQMQDVAIFGYILTDQQISHEWGAAHPGASCSGLVEANISGNANGGTFPNFADGPVSATATQTCAAGADPFVTFYYTLERYGVPPVAGAACYKDDTDVQVPWVTTGGPWVYCFPGGFPSPDPNAQQVSPYTVAKRVGTSPVTITFFQGEILTPCSVVYNGNAGPLYFIEAQNSYNGASPALAGSGIPLNATQAASGGLSSSLATSQSGTALSPAWGVTGPTAANCLPAPVNGTSSAGAITSDSAIGGEQAGSNYAPWVEQQGPFIQLRPASVQVGVNTAQAYTAAAYTSLGIALGDVTASTTLSISGGGTCDNVAHTCQAAAGGNYTVTGTYGTEQSQAALQVTAVLGYQATVAADNPLIHYKLDGTAPFADSGSLNHTGTDVSSNITTGQPGADGLGVTYPSSGSPRISFSPTGTPTTGARTYEFWLKTTDTNRRNLLDLGNGNLGAAGVLAEIGNTGSGTFRVYAGGVDTNWSLGLADGNWHMMDISYDGSNLLRAYKDGALFATVAVGVLNTDVVSTANLGGTQAASPYIGSLDEFAIYGSQLSGARIAAHFQASDFKAATAASTAYSASVLNNNPLDYYRFEETAKSFKDYGSAGLQATSLDGALTSGAGGIDGNGITIAGNDGVNFSASALPTTGARTFEMWLKSTDTGNRALFYYGSALGANGFYIAVNNSCGGCLRVFTGGVDYNSSNIGLTDGNWHLLDVEYDGSNIVTIFRDGQLVATQAVGVLNTTVTGNANFAGQAFQSPYVGSLDEFAAYGSALSQAQVVAHYEASSQGSTMTLTLSPATSTVLADVAVSYSATAHASGGASLGSVALNALSISATSGGASNVNANCNLGLQTCQAHTIGVYTVTGTYGTHNLSANATLTVSSSLPTYAQVVAGDSPSLYWRLDESSGTTAADASGNSLSGTLSGGVTLGVSGATPGGSAMTLNGSNGQIRTPQIAGQFPGASESLEVWVKTTVSGVVFNENPPSSGWQDVQVEVESGGQVRFGVYPYGASLNSGTTNVADGNWHYVVLTYNRPTTTLTGYVDGVSIGSVSYTRQVPSDGHTSDTAPTTQAFGVGQSGGTNMGTGSFFNGSVDEVAIYNYALSATQVSAHYAARNN